MKVTDRTSTRLMRHGTRSAQGTPASLSVVKHSGRTKSDFKIRCRTQQKFQVSKPPNCCIHAP
eukprot:7376512-Prymnesium_polylepis.1